MEAQDEESVRQAESLIDEVFGAHAAPGSVLTLDCLDETFRVWVGRVDGRAVSTAAYVGTGSSASTRSPPPPTPEGTATERR